MQKLPLLSYIVIFIVNKALGKENLYHLSSSSVFTDIDYEKLKARAHSDPEMAKDFDDLFPKERMSFIFPGTKWCGPGNIAENYDDLGTARETDMCCRDHDFCPDIIPGWETKYNLTNCAIYTRLSCECDEQFRQCLRNTTEKTSTVIGKFYFNILDTQCFRKDFPVISCKKWGGFLKMKCLEPEYDINGKKLYQWFDVPLY